MENFVIHKQGDEHYYAALLNNKGNIVLRGIDCSNLSECKYSINK
jgi:hypothetical protein